MLAISTASISLHSAQNINIAIITDSFSVMQSLKNPVIKTQTKLSCIKLSYGIAASNKLDIFWVIEGSESADDLANRGTALEILSPIPHSLINTRIKEWSNESFNQKW